MVRAPLAVLLLALLLGGGPARAADDTPGRFDYWLLALSWSPQYCQERPGEEQCQRVYGFVVHGLWPQHERGYPEFCGRSTPVEARWIDRLLPLMPSEKLIAHQWRKHGSCSGLSQDDYFQAIERVRRRTAIPLRFQSPRELLRLPQQALEEDFVAANPGFSADGIAVQCSGRFLREVRLCYSRDFEPRRCGIDVRDRCGESVTLRPSRSAY